MKAKLRRKESRHLRRDCKHFLSEAAALLSAGEEPLAPEDRNADFQPVKRKALHAQEE